MPVDTDSDAWRDAEDPGSMGREIVSFLAQHPSKAFSLYELVDELYDTDWATYHQHERLRDELGDDEYYERKRAGDLPDGADITPLRYQTITDRVEARLSMFAREGVVDTKGVAAEHFDVPQDADVPVYTLTTDADT